MNVLTNKMVCRFESKYPQAAVSVRRWHRVAKKARWQSLQDVRRVFAHADGVRLPDGREVTIFNIGGNDYRLITSIELPATAGQRSDDDDARGIQQRQMEGCAMSTRMQTITKKRPIRQDYLELVRAFPLRPIGNDREYDAAAAILGRLTTRPEGSLTPGEQEYTDTLALLIQDYDEQHFQIEVEDMTPLETLKYLMSESGMTPADLGRLLGNKALPSLILHGHRQLSKTHIRILADHFKVEPSLFL